MARKTILVCDKCSSEVAEGRGAVMRLTYTDARRGSWMQRTVIGVGRVDSVGDDPSIAADHVVQLACGRMK